MTRIAPAKERYNESNAWQLNLQEVLKKSNGDEEIWRLFLAFFC
jgi:hypothetical protein